MSSALICTWLLVGCASDDSEALDHAAAAQVAEGDGLPCDIAATLKANCALCHDKEPFFGAPMALASAADFQVKALNGKSMVEVVKTRINETDPRRAMPPASSRALTPAAKAAFNEWLDKGAPATSCGPTTPKPDAGTTTAPKPDAGPTTTPPVTTPPVTTPPAKPGTPDDGEVGSIDTTGLECFKLRAHTGDNKTPYKVGAARDKYLNFTWQAPWTGMAYGVVFRPIIDNKAAIHHWLLFQDTIPSAVGVAKPSSGAHPGGALLAGWAPGGEPLNLRAEAAKQHDGDIGVELPGNTTYTIEYHYNSSDANAVDSSGVEVCVQKTKPKNIASLSWLGYDQLLAPAQKWTGTCRPTRKEPITIIGLTPHMHKQGTHMKAVINRANGTKETLHDAPFDFNYQIQYIRAAKINAGDSITTECTFAKPMAFGESTTAEMCYMFTLAYPKNALSDGGLRAESVHSQQKTGERS